jgi:hypothetical protein
MNLALRFLCARPVDPCRVVWIDLTRVEGDHKPQRLSTMPPSTGPTAHSTEVALTGPGRSRIMVAVWLELEYLVCLTAGA